MQHLRKRQIVIIGNGLGVITFCRAFRSQYAEVTILTQEPNYAPRTVLNAVAAGRLDPAPYIRSLRILFSKRKDIRILNQTVASIDPETRKLLFTGDEDPVDYDFLLFANEPETHIGSTISGYSEALQIRSKLKEKGHLETVAIIGPGTQTVEAATAFAGTAEKVFLINTGDSLFPEAEADAPKNIHREIRETGVHLFMDEEFDSLEGNSLTIGGQTLKCDLVIDHRISHVPACATKLGLELLPDGKFLSRPDFSIPHQPRLYAFADLCDIQDGLGKKLPNIDRVAIKQARYLARILKGKIEAVKGYDVDCPGFIYSGAGDFVRLNTTGSVGMFGKKRVWKGFQGLLMDTLLHKLPVFSIAYGSGALSKWTSLFRKLK